LTVGGDPSTGALSLTGDSNERRNASLETRLQHLPVPAMKGLQKLWKFFGIFYEVVPEDQFPKIDWYTGKPLNYDVAHTDGFILWTKPSTRNRRRFHGAAGFEYSFQGRP
jgi:cytochrome oxidase Cu insertion factor (SCO1/SenC/PrrC family)